MIDYIYSSSGNYLQVTSSGSANSVYINHNPNNPMQGMIRLNGSTMEVFDGSYWRAMGTNGSADINLTGNAVAILKWAEKRMLEEARLKELSERHPAIKDAVDRLETTMDEIKVLVALTEEHNDA